MWDRKGKEWVNTLNNAKSAQGLASRLIIVPINTRIPINKNKSSLLDTITDVIRGVKGGDTKPGRFFYPRQPIHADA